MKKQSFIRSINTVFAVTLPLVALIACGQAHEQGASFDPNGASIVSGQTVKAADPLGKMIVALVMQDDQGEALCSGSIVADDTILTAAHCVDHNPTKIIVVFATDVKKSKPEQQRLATTFAQNPKWDSSPQSLGDLALVHFEGGLPAGYQTVQLASNKIKLAQGEPVIIIGYGVTDGGSQKGAGVLREAQTTIEQQMSPTQVVTDGSSSSVCFGDSGGPAFTTEGGQPLQWGVASSVASQDCKSEAVHTSIMSYHSWITKTIVALRQQTGSTGGGNDDGSGDNGDSSPKKPRKPRKGSSQSDNGFLP